MHEAHPDHKESLTGTYYEAQIMILPPVLCCLEEEEHHNASSSACVKSNSPVYLCVFLRLIPQTVGLLYVGNYDMPFAQMKVRETRVDSCCQRSSPLIHRLLKIAVSSAGALLIN